MRARRPAEVRRVVDVARLEPRLEPVRQVVRRPGGERDLLQRRRAVGALHCERTGRVVEIVLVDLELVRGDLARLLDDPLGRVVERDAADGERARSIGIHAERRDRRVAVQHLDLVRRAAEAIRDDLRERRLVSLAVRRGADERLHGSGREAANRRRVPAARAVPDRAEDPRGCEPAHLVVGREADPELLHVAAGTPLRLLAAQRIVVQYLERAVEIRSVVAGVDREAGGDRRGELLDEVAPPQLDRVDVEPARERVHRPLDRERGLGAAGAAVGVRRGRVGEDARALERVGVDVVAARVEPGAEQRHAGRDQLEVRAHRGGQAGADGGDLAVGVRRELDLLPHVAAVDRGEVALAALLGPLDRAAQPARQGQHEHLLRVDVQLGAEAAADVGRDHADLRLGNAEHDRGEHPEDVRDLRRRPQRQLVHDGLREAGARLDRVRDQPVLPQAAADGRRRLGEELVHLAGVERPRVAAVRAEVLVDDRSAVGERGLRVDDGMERLVVDRDELGRVLRGGTRVCDDDGDGVALVARLVRCERPVHRRGGVLGRQPGGRKRRLPVVRQVGAGEDGDDAVGRGGLRGVDALDLRVRVRAADDGHVDRARKRHVVDERALPDQELAVLLAGDALTDPGVRSGGGHLTPPRPGRP